VFSFDEGTFVVLRSVLSKGLMSMKLGLLLLAVSLTAKPIDITINAKGAILMNSETGAILFEKQAHVPLSPASTTKIATTLYVLERGEDLGRLATVSAEALHGRPEENRDKLPAYWLDSDGTMMHIKRGEVLSLDILLHGMMLVSGNDASNVVAEMVGGSVPGFMVGFNEYLQRLGCQNTRFSNPHGLTHQDHYSTAYDMARITKRALEFPKFRKLVSTLVYEKPKTNKQPAGQLKLTNPLMKPNSRYYYKKAVGVKTGYTNDAQQTLVAAAEHEGRTLIAVLLGCGKQGTRFEDAKRLFEAAFAEKREKRHLIGSDYMFAKEIEGSKKPLRANLTKALSIEYFPAEEPQCKAALHWDVGPLPIRKGQKVGEVYIQDDAGRLLEKGTLVAAEEVKGGFFFVLKQKFKAILHLN
jgi:D-alanyl-D-alanine carboxypeptidase (penicillin-binding protein 5/6)